jgi:hypothetical protein
VEPGVVEGALEILLELDGAGRALVAFKSSNRLGLGELVFVFFGSHDHASAALG